MFGFNKWEIKDGAIETFDNNDWLAGDTGIDLNNVPKLNPLITHVNQGKSTILRSACTIVGAYHQLCQVMMREATMEEAEEVVNYAVDNCGYEIGKGRASNLGTNAVVKWWNLKNKEKVFFIRFMYNDEEFDKLKDKLLLGCTYKGNRSYNDDRDDDGLVEGSEFGDTTYGHRLCISGGNTCHDSYYGRRTNIYKIKFINRLIKNGVFYPSMYAILKESWIGTKTVEQIKKEKSDKRKLDIATNSLSMVYQLLDETNKKKASELAKYMRSIGASDHISSDTKRIVNILTNSLTEYLSYIPKENRDKALQVLKSLNYDGI